MVTVRSYANPIDAALAKSVLDNYEVPCVLLNEASNLYSRGAQLAVPIELVVAEADSDRAIAILNGDFDSGAATEDTDTSAPVVDTNISDEGNNRNPWELLVLALYLLVPAVSVLARKFPITSTSSRIRYLILRAGLTQFFAVLAVVVAAILIGSYFWVRRSAVQRPSNQH